MNVSDARRRRAEVALVSVVFVVGLFVRWWIVHSRQGALNADEAFTGLQAMRIVDGDVPVVLEGQAYTAVFDSYLLAPVLAVFGPSVLILKWLPVLWWAIVSALVGRIVTTMSDLGTGWFAGALVWLAPGALLVLSTRAYEGYGLGAIFVLVLVTASRRAMAVDARLGRTAAVCGVAVGLAIWLHPMYLAVVAPVLVLPSWRHRRQGRPWWLPLVAGTFLSVSPLVAWNIRNEWQSFEQPKVSNTSYLSRLVRSFSELVPRMFGLRNSDGSWTLPVVASVIALSVLVVVFVRGVVVLWRRGPADRVLALTVVAVWPLLAIFRSTEFVADGRYGIVPFPFVVMAIALGIRELTRRIDVRSVFAAGLVVWIAVLSVPWLRVHDGPRMTDPNRDVHEVIDLVRARGFDRVAGSFWWVLPIEYLSDRAIRGAVAGRPFTVRVVDSQAIVSGSPPESVPFVFAADDDQPEVLRMPPTSYEKVVVGAAVVYLPQPGR